MSCSKDKRNAQFFENYHSFTSFPDERECEIKSLVTYKFVLPPLRLFIFQDTYILFQNSVDDEAMLWIYDIKKGEFTKKFGRKGKGPGEFIVIARIIQVDENTIGIFDGTLSRFSYYNVYNILSGGVIMPDSIKKIPVDYGLPLDIQKFDSNRFISYGTYYPNRYAIFDKNFDIISTHVSIPKKILDISNFTFIQSFDHPNIIYNDDIKMFAIGMKTYDMLQILNTDIEVIKSVHGPDHNFPDWTGKKKLSPEGYMPLTGSTHKIYGVYSGETPSTINDWIKSFGKNIHIFDWEGRPLKRIRTDYRIGDIVLSESQKRLYLVYYDEEYFRLGYIELLEDEI
jgi:hypothetical protein